MPRGVYICEIDLDQEQYNGGDRHGRWTTGRCGGMAWWGLRMLERINKLENALPSVYREKEMEGRDKQTKMTGQEQGRFIAKEEKEGSVSSPLGR